MRFRFSTQVRSARLFLLAAGFVLLAAGVCVRPALADTSAAQRYLHLRNSIAGALLPQADLNAVLSNPDSYYGRVVEASGRVVGDATTSGSRLVILQVGNVSADLDVPQAISESSPWLEAGNVVRVLVQAPPKSDTSGALRLIAVAPEADVSQLERQIALSSPPANALSHTASARYGRGGYETARGIVFDYRGLTPGHPTQSLPSGALAVYPFYRAQIARLNRRLSDAEIDSITTDILADSASCQIDPRLIIAMIIAESDFNPYSISPKGAVGLGQLMPETAAGMGVDPYDTDQNIRGAVEILSGNVNKYGGSKGGVVPLNTLLMTMAAYNAGSGAVQKYHGIPPYRETQRYVRKVAELYHRLAPDAVVADR